ncbi:MAG: hypothetical protein IBJ16_08710 [Chitinophagaceae bacterium]|nr:hypothetical protein [Chitinophagaceae bacterium]
MKSVVYRLKMSILISVLLAGCVNQQEHVTESSQVVEEDPGDVIYTNSTIIIQPTQVQLDSLQQTLKKSDTQIRQDDYVFYANAMTGFFTDKNVVNYHFSGFKSLHYKNAAGKIMTYELQNNGELWQLYFYSPEKGFYLANFSNYESEFKKFFNQ